ncbi:MAG: ABC transporter substrate-binding protein [Eubacteriales bacterium]|nr:ABC transporter substrate-binding protein [Eubacteriales bacterium]MDD3881195.1 ABC transporter substrate-binding protein [Eubacteriales bacterium]MDD4511577.1 ABC transporter substrate-binding protein [Eubacteriales bacterium]
MKRFLGILLSLLLVCSAFSFASAEGADVPAFDSFELGKDYTDLTAKIKWLTHRTDLVDNGAITQYVAEFNKVYPNITVEVEGITDFAQESLIRLTGSDDWGDVMGIPAVELSELSTYFAPYGTLEAMKDTYNFIDNKQFEGVVYGVPTTGNANGIVYNKAVFAAAGITELPKTPDQFIAALQAIKDKTDAIPLYTNYAAGWTMGAWDSYLPASVGDADFSNNNFLHAKDPFSATTDGTGPYAVYKILYDATAKGLIEDDYTTTDWEGCKPMINNGQIGCMVLGSWAFSQMRDAVGGEHPEDVGYMPFPVTAPDGKQYAPSGADYCYGINCKVDASRQTAAMVFVKWMTYESNFAYNEGGIPIVKTGNYPDLYSSFGDCDFLVQNVAAEGEDSLKDEMNAESTLMIDNGGNEKVQKIVEHGFNGDMSFDDIMNSWNELWSDAQESLGVAVR